MKPLSFVITRHGLASNHDVSIKVGYGRYVLHGKEVCRLAPSIITVYPGGRLRIRRPRRRRKVSAKRREL